MWLWFHKRRIPWRQLSLLSVHLSLSGGEYFNSHPASLQSLLRCVHLFKSGSDKSPPSEYSSNVCIVSCRLRKAHQANSKVMFKFAAHYKSMVFMMNVGVWLHSRKGTSMCVFSIGLHCEIVQVRTIYYLLLKYVCGCVCPHIIPQLNVIAREIIILYLLPMLYNFSAFPFSSFSFQTLHPAYAFKRLALSTRIALFF